MPPGKTINLPKRLTYLTLAVLGGGLLVPVISYATLTLDSTSLTSDGALTLKSASSSAINFGHPDQSGTITIASSTQTLTLNLGIGSGATTVNIATGTSSAKTINIGTGNQTINTITIGNASSSVAVSGTLRITEGNQGANKFLGSDASGNATWQAIAGADGWTDAGETWAFNATDAPSYEFYVVGDKTGKYQAGQRVKLTQTTVKYFIITKVLLSGPNTIITVYGGTDYTLANAAISANFYSGIKAPFGFPLDPLKWTVEVRDTTNVSQATPTNGTWYNLGSISLSIPIGAWSVEYMAHVLTMDTDNTRLTVSAALSTANNSASDSDLVGHLDLSLGAVHNAILDASIYRRKHLLLATKTTYYLNAMTGNNGVDSIQFWASSSGSPTIVRAVSAYL